MKRLIVISILILVCLSACKKSKIDYNNAFNGKWINKNTGDILLFEEEDQFNRKNQATFYQDSSAYNHDNGHFFDYYATKDSITFKYGGPLNIGWEPVTLSYSLSEKNMKLELNNINKLPYIKYEEEISLYLK